ncbi:LysM peptidoglycan-binding domain-containing protein [Desulforudis sp. 1190]
MNTRKIIGIGVVGLGLVLAVLIPANARYHELIKTSETKAPSYRPLSEIVNTDEPRFYQVQKGDTLWTIARRHQVTVSSLAMANGIDDHDCIRVGQKLVIPDGKPRDIRHRVGAGETLWDIARKYNVSVNDLVKANRFRNPNLIVQGQQIVVPVRSLALPARTEWGPLM